MLGRPKFKYNDEVQFEFNGSKFSGRIYIVDAFGTFEQNNEVSYDIMVEHYPDINGGPCLVKHILETSVEPIGS